MSKKSLALLISLVLVIGVVAGSTVAWLVATDVEVVNTFSPSTIKIDLSEENKGVNYDFKMVPGTTMAKDPKVVVEEGSEPCWLFIAVDASENLDTFIEYAISNDWTPYSTYTNIYYREVGTALIGDPLYILKGQGDGVYANGFVTVNDNITESDMEGIATNKPTLTFNACAVQRANIGDVDTAWGAADATFKGLAK